MDSVYYKFYPLFHFGNYSKTNSALSYRILTLGLPDSQIRVQFGPKLGISAKVYARFAFKLTRRFAPN